MADSPFPTRAAAAAVTTTVTTVCPVFLVGGLSVQIASDLQFTPFQLGLAVAMYFAVAAVSGVPCGYVVENFGTRVSGRTAVVLTSACLCAIALAENYVMLTVCLATAGAANTLGQLAANALLSRRVPRRRQGLMFGVKQAAVPLSTTLAGAAVPAVALTAGWRWAFVLAAVLALAAWPVLPPTLMSPAQLRDRAKAAVKRPGLALATVAVAGALGSTAANPLGSFLADYGVSQGLSESAAGLNLTVAGIAGVAARISVGWIADRRDGGRLLMVAAMLVGGSAGVAMLAAGGAWAVPVGAVVGFALGWAWPGLINFAVTRLHSDAPAAATGVVQTGVAMGGAVGPLAFGAVVQFWGYSAAWWGASATMLLAAGVMLIGRTLILASRQAATAPPGT